MMSDIDKIKDYVTHEQRPVTGDSHGNFVISPMGFPNVNESGYPESGRVPTLFLPQVTTKPASLTGIAYRHNVPFRFLKFDDDNNMFATTVHFTKVSDQPRLQVTFVSDNIAFYAIDSSTTYRVNVTAPDALAQYKSAMEGEYTLEFDNGSYLLYRDNEIAVEFPEEGLDVELSFIPSNGDLLVISGQTDSSENGIYKIYVEEREDGNYFRWVRKGNIPDSCFTEEVTFDGTENDNVEGVYDDPTLNHYRKGKSQQEVAKYLREAIGEATECGKFNGEQYAPDSHGLLVKWFLSNGEISLGNSSHPILIDSFGRIDGEADVVGCNVETGDTAESVAEYEAQRKKINIWKLNTVGTTAANDWPYKAKSSCYHNNITLTYKDMNNIGGRHNIVMDTDLSEHDGKIAPKKTFIHLPTPLDLKDGTEYEFNVSLPIIENPTGDTLTAQKLSGYYSYMTQPRAYILSGLQKSIDNNNLDASTLTISNSGFTFYLKHSLEQSVGQISYSMYNSYECQKAIRFTGTVSAVDCDVTFHVDDSGVTHYNMIDVPDTMIISEGSKILLEYNSDTITSDNLDGESVQVRKLYRIEKVYHDYPDEMFYVTLASTVDATDGETGATLYRNTVQTEAKFPYDYTSRIWSMRNKDNTCIIDIKYVDTTDDKYAGLTERDNDSIFGSAPETNDIDSDISEYNQNFRVNSTDKGKIASDDKRVVIATVYPTATNTFPWRMNNRRRIKHLGLSSKRDVDYGYHDKILPDTYASNANIYNMLESMYHLGGKQSCGVLPINYSATVYYKTLIGSIVRVAMPNSLDSDVMVNSKDETSLVSQAALAYKTLVKDFKISRIGYKHENSYSWGVSKDTQWFKSTAHSGEITGVSSLLGSDSDRYSPSYNSSTIDGITNKLNEWGIKLLHLPNFSLGVYPNSTSRAYEYAGWSPAEFTKDTNYQFFYSTAGVTDAIENENLIYESKTAGGTTQMTEDKYSISSVNGTLNSLPFNYPGQHSLINVFVPGVVKNSVAHNQLSSIINGYLEHRTIACGLRNTCFLTDLEDEFYNGRYNDEFYPTARLFSADGIVFPDFKSTSLQTLDLDDDAIRNQIIAYPYAYVFAKDVVDGNVADTVAPIISMYRDSDALNDFVKSALTMYAQKMPFHMYNPFKYELRYNGTGATLDNPEVYYHEITLYKKQVDKINTGIMDLMQFNLNTNMTACKNTSYTENHSAIIDPNMTYQPLVIATTATPWKDIVHTATLSGPNELANEEYMSARFEGCYTRIHIGVIFSAELGRWIIKDYYQIPTNYLTPAYGAATLGAKCKSYVVKEGNSAMKADLRVPKSEGMNGTTFSIEKYKSACQEQSLWHIPCGESKSYEYGMSKPYYEQGALDINPGCIPFISTEFPYDSNGNFNHNSSFDFKNIYDHIKVPMDVNGNWIDDDIDYETFVNFWSLKWHCRPARSAMPGSHIPTLESRNDEDASISAPTLGMFDDINSEEPLPERTKDK